MLRSPLNYFVPCTCCKTEWCPGRGRHRSDPEISANFAQNLSKLRLMKALLNYQSPNRERRNFRIKVNLDEKLSKRKRNGEIGEKTDAEMGKPECRPAQRSKNCDLGVHSRGNFSLKRSYFSLETSQEAILRTMRWISGDIPG